MNKNAFWYHQGETYCESVPLSRIAREVGTPTYVYSKAVLSENGHTLKAAFSTYPTLACYAIKANGNYSMLKHIFELGFGAEVVSVGELERALRAGANPKQIVFSGVGKQEHEIRRAMEAGIFSFNVESAFELDAIHEVAKSRKEQASFVLRINPNIDVKTNPHIATGLYCTKFGISEEEARELGKLIKQNEYLKFIGLSCHIGSQITDLGPFAESAQRMVALSREFMAMGHPFQVLDLGGGLGISYQGEEIPAVEDYARALIGPVRKLGLKLIIEPGRSLVGKTGVLLTKVIGLKSTPAKKFVVVDGAMNDLIRPCLYEAYHEIESVVQAPVAPNLVDIVGPICETADFFGHDRKLPNVRKGDVLYVKDCGAYGFSMASNYNSRPRPAEVLVDGASFTVARRRETLNEIWAMETTTA